MYIVDTNVMSEIRKIGSGKANQGVKNWAINTPYQQMYLNTIVVSELEAWVLSKARKDVPQGAILHTWLHQTVLPNFAGRIVDIDRTIALESAKLHVPDKKPVADALIAATAMVHELIVVTRNVQDFDNMPVKILNPFTTI